MSWGETNFIPLSVFMVTTIIALIWTIKITASSFSPKNKTAKGTQAAWPIDCRPKSIPLIPSSRNFTRPMATPKKIPKRIARLYPIPILSRLVLRDNKYSPEMNPSANFPNTMHREGKFWAGNTLNLNIASQVTVKRNQNAALRKNVFNVHLLFGCLLKLFFQYSADVILQEYQLGIGFSSGMRKAYFLFK